MRNFREYEIWQRAVRLTIQYYQIAHNFPEAEKYGLVNQLKRAFVSISSNIAEGCSRSSEADFARMLEIALGSTYEVESQLLLSVELGFIQDNIASSLIDELHQLQKQIASLIKKIRSV